MKRILGIGNALVDSMTLIEDETLLATLQLPKGSMQLVDAHTAEKVKKASDHLTHTMASGGSAANTIRGLARLGAPTAFIGHVGDDETGRFFSDDLKQAGVSPLLFSSKTPSGIAHAFVTKDGERTFATFLGAAIELSASHLKQELFEGYDYLYVEGYLVQNRELLNKAIELAQSAGLKVAIDLASFNVVEDNKDFLNDILNHGIDLVFANEEESKALTGLSPAEALDQIGQKCEIAVVKIGSEGSLIKKGTQTYKVSPIKASAIDTTGAGDMYAAGFLFGLTNGYSIERAGHIGSLLAANVIEVIGANMDDSRWEKILKAVQQNS